MRSAVSASATFCLAEWIEGSCLPDRPVERSEEESEERRCEKKPPEEVFAAEERVFPFV